MTFTGHFRTTGGALKNWLVAQTYDAIAVGALWLLGLLIIQVPGAFFWAFLGAVFQFIPNFGPIFTLIGAEVGAMFSGSAEKMLYVLILYAIVMVVDGLFLQPYLMKRTVKVPIWASILAPVVLGIVWPFWGVLVAAPLLAVFYAFRTQKSRAALASSAPPRTPPTPP